MLLIMTLFIQIIKFYTSKAEQKLMFGVLI